MEKTNKKELKETLNQKYETYKYYKMVLDKEPSEYEDNYNYHGIIQDLEKEAKTVKTYLSLAMFDEYSDLLNKFHYDYQGNIYEYEILIKKVMNAWKSNVSEED